MRWCCACAGRGTRLKSAQAQTLTRVRNSRVARARAKAVAQLLFVAGASPRPTSFFFYGLAGGLCVASRVWCGPLKSPRLAPGRIRPVDYIITHHPTSFQLRSRPARRAPQQRAKATRFTVAVCASVYLMASALSYTRHKKGRRPPHAATCISRFFWCVMQGGAAMGPPWGRHGPLIPNLDGMEGQRGTGPLHRVAFGALGSTFRGGQAGCGQSADNHRRQREICRLAPRPSNARLDFPIGPPKRA